MLHMRNNFEFSFTQPLKEEFCHHQNKTRIGLLTSFPKVCRDLLSPIALKSAILHPQKSSLMNSMLLWSMWYIDYKRVQRFESHRTVQFWGGTLSGTWCTAYLPEAHFSQQEALQSAVLLVMVDVQHWCCHLADPRPHLLSPTERKE